MNLTPMPPFDMPPFDVQPFDIPTAQLFMCIVCVVFNQPVVPHVIPYKRAIVVTDCLPQNIYFDPVWIDRTKWQQVLFWKGNQREINISSNARSIPPVFHRADSR